MNGKDKLGKGVSVNFFCDLTACATRAMLLLAALLMFLPVSHAQTTATITGTVNDSTGAIVPNARVTLVNQATQDTRNAISNVDGRFAFAAVLPGSYTIKISLKDFKSWTQHDVIVNSGDQLNMSNIALIVGATTEEVTVQSNDQIIPTDSGERAAVLSNNDIEQLALEGRNISELLKVLPGVTVAPNGTSNGPSFNFINNGVDQSSVGNGIDANGTPNRGATSQLSDGVDINDPGCNCNNILSVNPDMTQEVTVQTSNFGADVAHGPVIVQSISKSGGAQYHGEGYFYARNDQINANDWQDNHNKTQRGSGHYYYPGGNFGGPVPKTGKRLLFWGGYESLRQNTGNSNVLTSNVPSPDMLAGNFTPTTANNAICPNGFVTNAPQAWCNSINGTILPDGTTVTNGIIPSQFIDPGAAVLASFWPKANADPSSDGGYNYRQVIPGTHDGYIYRARVDYNLNESNKFYVSYQGGYDSQLDQGNGAHIYWTPGNSIPYPGGGLGQFSTSRALAGHFVHIFNATLTNEFIASWGYGSFPSGPPNADAAFRSTLGYPSSYGTVFNNGAKLIPSYSSAGQYTFPDFSQSDIFEPTGLYTVRKELPEFEDNLTKVWGAHTLKFGVSTENVDNLQAPFSNLNGSINSFSGQQPTSLTTPFGLAAGSPLGSANNPVANFTMGIVTSYDEWNKAPLQDLAYQDTAPYVDDSWKVTKRLTVEAGFRFDHITHWYDRGGDGIAVYYPNQVIPDWNDGKIDPGMYWHGISSGIPLSGQPNRLFHVSPRFGIAWDVFGTGKTVIRGGWGAYRFNDQYNDYSAALSTAQAVDVYNLPSNHSVLLSQIHELTPPPVGVPQQVSGGVTAMAAGDWGIPVVDSYNLTISEQLPWKSLLDVAYVGNGGRNLLMGGETISGSGFGDYVNVNKVPLGAYFAPDPVTGLYSLDPQNLNKLDCPTLNVNSPACVTNGPNTDSDYHPLAKEYGNQSVQVFNHVGYSNYNALQIDWVKRSSSLTYDINFTHSKTLNTGLQINPFVLGANYGPSAQDRTNVLNASGAYNSGAIYRGDNKFLGGAVNGWTISNITTWQSGGNFQVIDSPNLGLSLNYDTTTLPTTGPLAPGGNYGNTGIGAPTYFGTSAAIDVMPVTTCNPGAGLAGDQRAKLGCFAPQGLPTPFTVANQAGQIPYLRMAAYWDSDLALYKTFHVTERQSVQFRASAFNWLNHPLPQFSGSNQLNLAYKVNYNSGSATSNVSTPDWGFLDTKTGNPNQRILEFALKYMF
jgi:hypothetical protein